VIGHVLYPSVVVAGVPESPELVLQEAIFDYLGLDIRLANEAMLNIVVERVFSDQVDAFCTPLFSMETKNSAVDHCLIRRKA
jgi:hypothetical protein